MARRENMLATLAHQSHDHLGNTTDVFGTGGALETFENGPMGGGLDGFGLKWASTTSAMGGGRFRRRTAQPCTIFRIGKWSFNFPNLDEYDWKGQAKAQLAHIDPKNHILEYGMWNAQFLRIAHMMGFEDCLVAMVEEPEACGEFLDAVTDFKVKLAEKVAQYYKAEVERCFRE
jgi:hypothetical protein